MSDHLVDPARSIVDANLESVRRAYAERVGADLRAVAWLGERTCILVFRVERLEELEPRFTVFSAGSANPLLTRSHAHLLADDPTVEGRVILAMLPDTREPTDRSISIHVQSWRRSVEIDVEHVFDRTVSLRTLVRRELAGLDAEARGGVIELVSGVSDWTPTLEGGAALPDALLLIRDALREPLPSLGVRTESRRIMAVDSLLAVCERSFWIKGWLRPTDLEPTRLTAVAPEGLTAELLQGAFRHDRPDLHRTMGDEGGQGAGFVHYFELPGASRSPRGWLCELHGARDALLELPVPAVAVDPAEVQRSILAEIARAGDDVEFLIRNHVHPAIERLQQRDSVTGRIRRLRTYGDVPKSPLASIVVPLQGPPDRIEHQHAQFVHDRETRRAELIYALDGPRHEGKLTEVATHLFRLYGVPFRTVVLDRSGGVARLLNCTAEIARARVLIRMDPDTLPAGRGWIGALVRASTEMPKAGVVGPKLLYPDGSVRSAGVFFRPVDEGTGWEPAHLLAGLHRGFGAACVPGPVSAVSGPCFAVDRAWFLETGGLSSGFLPGEHQSLDLSLRAAHAGRSNWYIPEAEAFQLGGDAPVDRVRTCEEPYNRWLLHHRWPGLFEDLAERHPVEGHRPTREGASSARPETGRSS